MKRVASGFWHILRTEYGARGAGQKLSEKLLKEAKATATYADKAAVHKSILATQSECGVLNVTYEDILREGYQEEEALTDLVDNWWRPRKTGVAIMAGLETFLCINAIGRDHHSPPLFWMWVTMNAAIGGIVLVTQRYERVANFKAYAKKKAALDYLASTRAAEMLELVGEPKIKKEEEKQ